MRPDISVLKRDAPRFFEPLIHGSLKEAEITLAGFFKRLLKSYGIDYALYQYLNGLNDALEAVRYGIKLENYFSSVDVKFSTEEELTALRDLQIYFYEHPRICSWSKR